MMDDKLKKAAEASIKAMQEFTKVAEQLGASFTTPQWVPEVGERIEIRKNDNDWREVTVVAHNDGGVIYRDPATTDHRYAWAIGGGMRPLPTDEDRAVEEMVEIFNDGILMSIPDRMRNLYKQGYRKQPQPAEDMSDPANWRAGDVVECVSSEATNEPSYFTEGKHYTVVENDGSDNYKYLDDEKDDMWARNDGFRFIRRP